MQQRQWRGPERRRSEGAYDGENRRRPRPAGYRDDGTPGVNAEEPRTEQDESLLHRARGPDPRKKIQPGELEEAAGGPGVVPQRRDQSDIH
jgi:hypothetical protein